MACAPTILATLIDMKIDNLKPGSIITLKFHGSYGNESYTEEVLFVGIDGEGDGRIAVFRSASNVAYTWQAYRYRGRWAYGTSADRLTVVK
jgi:hypothetical protein